MAWITVENLQRAINGIAAKVTELFVKKEDGKTLTSNDFTDAMKTKLEGIETEANKYEHPTTAGSKHIPTGGTKGQVLVNSASGTAVWQDPEETEVPNMQGATASAAGKAGIVPAPPAGGQNKVLTGSATWVELAEATEAEIDQIIAGAFK